MSVGSGVGDFNGSSTYTLTSTTGYLIIGNSYWTMTPVEYYNPFDSAYSIAYAYMFDVRASGVLEDHTTALAGGVRPVINISSDVTIIGSGTVNDVYRIS